MKFYTCRDSKSNAEKVPTVFPSRHNGTVFLPKELRGRQKYRKQQRPQFCGVNKHSKSLNSEVSKLGPDASRGSHGVATHMPLNYGGPQVHANLRPKTSHTTTPQPHHTIFSRCDTTLKGSPYWITERKVPELIPVLGSQHAGDVSHKPGGRLPLLSARPEVTPATLKRAATNFAAW